MDETKNSLEGQSQITKTQSRDNEPTTKAGDKLKKAKKNPNSIVKTKATKPKAEKPKKEPKAKVPS